MCCSGGEKKKKNLHTKYCSESQKLRENYRVGPFIKNLNDYVRHIYKFKNNKYII